MKKCVQRFVQKKVSRYVEDEEDGIGHYGKLTERSNHPVRIQHADLPIERVVIVNGVNRAESGPGEQNSNRPNVHPKQPVSTVVGDGKDAGLSNQHQKFAMKGHFFVSFGADHIETVHYIELSFGQDRCIDRQGGQIRFQCGQRQRVRLAYDLSRKFRFGRYRLNRFFVLILIGKQKRIRIFTPQITKVHHRSDYRIRLFHLPAKFGLRSFGK